MLSRRRFAGAACVFALCVLVGAARAGENATPKVGEKAPDFSLPKLDDQEVKLSDLTGQGPVVLIVLRGWVGYQCPICTKQVGDFAARAKEIRAKGAKVLLVYPGTNKDLKKHAADFEPGKNLPENFVFVMDPDLKFVDQYGLRWNEKGETAYPSTFVIDKQGAVRFEKVSHSHGGRASAKEVIKVLDEIK